MFKGPKRPVLASFVFAGIAFLFVTAKKVFDYAAPPARPKDCNFIFPVINDQSKPTKIVIDASKVSFPVAQMGGHMNDASCLNKTAVFGVAKVRTVDDISRALQFARDNHLKVAAAGQRHSMGGQSFSPGGLVLDMRDFNQVKLDRERKVLTAQTGATWEQIQLFLDPRGSRFRQCSRSTFSPWVER